MIIQYNRLILTRQISNTAKSWIPLILFVLALFVRSPLLFIDPRFWAEEGNVYFEKIRHVGRIGGLLQVVNGNYQFLTNLFVEIAVHVPLSIAPIVTTYLSLAISAYCAWMISEFFRSKGCTLGISCMACVFFALQPAGYEVFMSATNVQWVTSVIAFIILLLPSVPASSNIAFRNYSTIVICGLTGTTTCIMLPLFILRALRSRDKYSIILQMILLILTIMQILIIIINGEEIHRPFELSALMPTSMSLQIVFANFLPISVVDAIGRQIAAVSVTSIGMGSQVAFVGILFIAVLSFIALPRIGWTSLIFIILGITSVSFVNELGSLGNTRAMLSGWAGGRYFFLGASLFIILIVISVEGRSKFLGISTVLLLFSGTLINFTEAGWSNASTNGPSFRKQLTACGKKEVCHIEIWPFGWYNEYRITY